MAKARYRRRYCRAVLDYFGRPAYAESVETLYHTNGEVKQERTVREPSELPTFEEFAAGLGVCRETLDAWQREHPEFADACAVARCRQRHILIANGLRGGYNAAFARFVGTAVLGMADAGTGEAPLPAILDDVEDTP